MLNNLSKIIQREYIMKLIFKPKKSSSGVYNPSLILLLFFFPKQK